jgi:hypothetical protein
VTTVPECDHRVEKATSFEVRTRGREFVDLQPVGLLTMVEEAEVPPVPLVPVVEEDESPRVRVPLAEPVGHSPADAAADLDDREPSDPDFAD